MGGIVTHQLERFIIPAGDDGEFTVVFDQVRGIDKTIIDAAGHGGLDKTGTDIGGDLMYGDRFVEFTLGTIGERDNGHIPSSSVVAHTRGHMKIKKAGAMMPALCI
jgi:hydrogenase maturation factor HypE